ncbi:MAG: trypsin-like peptidase domain-containing protein [Patescibacteria group bacterium]|nr:trypsin-like peptidase domain-containing protein [Patescibacteria group bacterium]
MNKDINKKIIVFSALFALFGAILGSFVLVKFTSANTFDDVLNKLRSIFNPQQSIGQPTLINNKVNIPVAPYQSTDSHEQAVISAVKQVSPAVVSIIISKDVPVIEQCPYNNSPFSNLPPEFQQFFGFGSDQFYQPCQKGTQKQEVGGGSGFIISSDGLILTNKHVVSEKNASYTVLTNDGKKYDAKVLAQDPATDLAVVKINQTGLPTVKLGDSDSVQLGQTAIAIGNALGEFRNTVSAGVISGLARTITASGAGISETIEGVFQTDAAINAGNSGGPLLNLKGEVIGINTAMVSGAQNIGFAIPINKAKRDIDSVKTTGKIISPYLGVRYILITPDLAKKEKLSVENGALVRGEKNEPAVIKNSPAGKAGIQAEDIIVSVNGVKIDQNNSLASLVQKYKVGDKINLKVLRNGKELSFEVILEERK